jgi:hypothetical protein
MNNWLFQLPGLNTLRSYEKVAIFTPFIFAVLFTVALINVKTPVWRSTRTFFLILVLLLPLPFYFGNFILGSCSRT